MYMERIQITAPVTARARKPLKPLFVGLAVLMILVPYLALRIALSGLHMFAHTLARGLVAVSDIALREVRRTQ